MTILALDDASAAQGLTNLAMSSPAAQTLSFTYYEGEAGGGGEECASGMFDCNGECDGMAMLDCAGVCDTDSSNDAVFDCAGECGSECASGWYDCAGVCDGMAVEDCFGVCDGGAVVDECGVCDGSGYTMLSLIHI